MKKKLIFLILALSLVLSVFTVSSSASAPSVRPIYDGADFLTSAQEDSLLRVIADAEEQSGARYYIYLCASDYYPVTETAIMTKLALDTDDNAVVFLIEKLQGTYYYEMFTYGDAYGNLSNGDCNSILDDDTVYSNIKGGNLSTGIRNLISLTADRMSGNIRTGKILRIIIPIILALLADGGAVGFVVYKYKRKLKSPIYPLSKYASLNLTNAQDNYVTSNVVRTRVASSSSGSRSGGGRSGGGSRGRR